MRSPLLLLLAATAIAQNNFLEGARYLADHLSRCRTPTNNLKIIIMIFISKPTMQGKQCSAAYRAAGGGGRAGL